ncbi:MAG: hypothetical protein WA823_06185 [Candidatus Acidiferrales bacterium]
MLKKFPTCVRGLKLLVVNLVALVALPALFSAPSGRATTTAHAAPLPRIRVNAIPAFARKYGLPCSACHTAWPELNNFGQVFRDNGYQLMNDRDSPIWQNPSYFPVTFRITPNWHRESTNNQPIDSIPGGGPASSTIAGRVTQAGFDLSGMDLWSAGTLYKNISFVLLPSSDSTAVWHFEAAWVRFDNLKNSSWLNLRFGRFELDNLISEKRMLFLSNNGGFYQIYHFNVPGSSNDFGYGDNQIGIELAGHSKNSYTRYSVAMLSSNEGGVNFTTDVVPGAPPSNRSYDVNLAFSQAFNAGSLGLERLGVFSYIGQRPTYYQTTGDGTVPLVGLGNKPFYRVGFAGDLFLGKLELLPLFMYGHDNAYLGSDEASTSPLPGGAPSPTFAGGFIEAHYYVNPQLVFLGRFEKIDVTQQALVNQGTVPGNYGDVTAYSVGYRWYPIMFSRAGLAFHNEYSISKSIGIVPESGDGTGLPPLFPTNGVWSSSIFIGFDFDF